MEFTGEVAWISVAVNGSKRSDAQVAVLVEALVGTGTTKSEHQVQRFYQTCVRITAQRTGERYRFTWRGAT